MSTATSDSYQSTDSEWESCPMDSKMNSLECLTESFSKDIKNSDLLVKSIAAYKKNHLRREQETRENMKQLAKSFAKIQKENKNICTTRLTKINHTLKPYIKEGDQIPESEGDLRVRMSNCAAKVSGLHSGIKSTENISNKVTKDYATLDMIEKKQIEIIQRYEEVTRVQNLADDIPPNDSRYNMVQIPELLLALSISPETSGYYQKRIKVLQQRMSCLVAQIRFNSKEIGFELPSDYPEQLQNGEITAQSLSELSEFFLDSLKTASSPQI